jgi:hypothetical protein
VVITSSEAGSGPSPDVVVRLSRQGGEGDIALEGDE